MVASFLLDDMTKINQVWHSQQDQVSPFVLEWDKNHLIKRDTDDGIKKMLTQMELLLKHIKENVEKQKGICIVFRVKEGSSSCYSRPGRIKVWTLGDTMMVSTQAVGWESRLELSQ